jgi:hypothetical protein
VISAEEMTSRAYRGHDHDDRLVWNGIGDMLVVLEDAPITPVADVAEVDVGQDLQREHKRALFKQLGDLESGNEDGQSLWSSLEVLL